MNNAPYQKDGYEKNNEEYLKMYILHCFRTPFRCQKVIFQETTSWRQRYQWQKKRILTPWKLKLKLEQY